MLINKINICFIFLLLIVSSCKHTKKIVSKDLESNKYKSLEKNIKNAEFKYNFLSAKAKVKYNDGSNSQSFTANIRLEKGKKVWMSLTGPFGIEGARAYITPNRVQLIDRLNNRYYDEEFTFVNNYLPFSSDIHFIQDMLIGNALLLDFENADIDKTDHSTNILSSYNNIFVTNTFNEHFKFTNIKVKDEEAMRSLNMSLEEFGYIEKQLFSFLRKLNYTDAKRQINLEMNYTKVKHESSLDFPFSVPDKFKK